MRRALLLLSILAMPGCTSSWYVGRWEITDAVFPGVSAMGMDEARKWFGAAILYSDSAVTFRSEICADPRFRTESLTKEDFRTLYRATFAQLDIEGESAPVLHVDCPSNWTAPGSTLIRASDDTGYMPWDGVFFKLVRTAP